MISRPRFPSVLVLGLSLFLATGAFAATATVCTSTDTAATDTKCGCDTPEGPPVPLDSFFYSVQSYTVSAQSTQSGPQYQVAVPAFNGRVVWQLSFEPVVYPGIGEAANQENAARLQAIAQALAGGSLSELGIELRDNFNGDSTFLAIINGEPNETLDRAGARQALFGDGSAFSSGERLRAVAFVNALGYEGVPMILHGRVEAATMTTTTTTTAKVATMQEPPAPAPLPQPPAPAQWAACARSLDGKQCNQNPPTLPCPNYAYTQWVKISCPTGENYSLPFWKLLLQWDFWKSLVCRCSFDYESKLEVRAGSCNWYRPILTPWNTLCGCT